MSENYPNVLIIGSQKSGTTSLADSLGLHSEVFVSEPREPEFLSRAARGESEDWDSYRALFSDSRNRRVRLEASTGTMLCGKTAHLVSERFPDVKLIALLRNPVARAYSGYVHSVKKGYVPHSDRGTIFETEAASYLDGLDCKFDWFARSEYFKQLQPFVERFGTNLKVVIFEELLADKESVMNDVQDFLGLEPESLTLLKENQTLIPKSGLSSAVVAVGRRLVGPVRRGVGEKSYRNFRSAVMKVLGSRPESINPALAEELWKRKYEAQTQKLESLLGRDLEAWK